MATIAPDPAMRAAEPPLSPLNRKPAIKTTRYDIVTSLLWSAVGMVIATLAVMVAIYLANLLETPVRPKVEVLPAGDGGWEDGDPDATPDVESPEDPSDDPSLANEQSDVTELMEITDPVVDVAENAAQLVEPNAFTDAQNTGNPGSAEGTGGRPLGSGGPGKGGAKRDNGWVVEFADRGDLESYARQLDFFGIELGVFFPTEERLVYMTDMGAGRPSLREVTTGKDEKRLHLNWAGGDRKQADIELFQKAGVDARQGNILHFYPSELEQQMAQLEHDYANRTPDKIRKTYFQVKKKGNGYEFVVDRQTLR